MLVDANRSFAGAPRLKRGAAMEGVSRQEFAEAVSAAVASVKHIYRELDRLIATLKESLIEEPDSLKVVRGSTGKGLSAKQHGRVVVRDEYSILFEPGADDEGAEGEAEDEDDGDGAEDDAAAGSGSRRRSAPVELDPEQPLLALRVSVATARVNEAFEPSLQYAVLGKWSLGLTDDRPRRPIVLKRNMMRRITWILESADTSRRILTAAKVPAGRGSHRGERTLSCRILGGIQTVPLYDLDEPRALDDLAEAMKDHWRRVNQESAPA
jgi:hypothetical protein